MFTFGMDEYLNKRVCLSNPSWSRSSRSAMSFGLAVGGWLTFKSPSFHYTLKTLTDSTNKHAPQSLFTHAQISRLLLC